MNRLSLAEPGSRSPTNTVPGGYHMAALARMYDPSVMSKGFTWWLIVEILTVGSAL